MKLPLRRCSWRVLIKAASESGGIQGLGDVRNPNCLRLGLNADWNRRSGNGAWP